MKITITRARGLQSSGRRIVLLLTSAWMLVCAVSASAQMDVKAFEAELKGRQLALRNYSDDDVVRYDWTAGTLSSAPPSVKTFAVFVPDKVRLKHDTLVVSGTSGTLVQDSTTNEGQLTGLFLCELDIALHGAAPADVLRLLKAQLFFDSLADARAVLPRQLAATVPFQLTRGKPTLNHAAVATGKYWVERGGETIQVNPSDVTFTPFKHSGSPDFGSIDMALLNTPIAISFRISEMGKTSDFWITLPIDHRTDMRFVDELRKSVMQPAVYQGQPVAITMDMEMDFERHY